MVMYMPMYMTIYMGMSHDHRCMWHIHMYECHMPM